MPYRVYVLGCLLAVVVVMGLLIRDGRAAVVASSGSGLNGVAETPPSQPIPPPPTAPPIEVKNGVYAPIVIDMVSTPVVWPTETPGLPPVTSEPPTAPPGPTHPSVTGETPEVWPTETPGLPPVTSEPPTAPPIP